MTLRQVNCQNARETNRNITQTHGPFFSSVYCSLPQPEILLVTYADRHWRGVWNNLWQCWVDSGSAQLREEGNADAVRWGARTAVVALNIVGVRAICVRKLNATYCPSLHHRSTEGLTTTGISPNSCPVTTPVASPISTPVTSIGHRDCHLNTEFAWN